MLVFVAAIIFAFSSLDAHAEGRTLMAELDLRLPKEAMAPDPIYIIINSRPDTLLTVKLYALSVLNQIDVEFKNTPTLDKDGRPFCVDMTVDTLIALEKNGQLVDVAFPYKPSLDPRGLRDEVKINLRRAAQRLSPFPPFPEAERLGKRLVGIPAIMTIQCKRGWVKIESPN